MPEYYEYHVACARVPIFGSRFSSTAYDMDTDQVGEFKTTSAPTATHADADVANPYPAGNASVALSRIVPIVSQPSGSVSTGGASLPSSSHHAVQTSGSSPYLP